MVHERWSSEDSQERRDRIKDADVRLESWAKWSRIYPGGAANSNWFMALSEPKPEDNQAGAKHVAAECPDEEAMQVDAVVASWKRAEPGFWKVVRKEYLTYGTQESKALALGLSRAYYCARLDELRLALWRALDLSDRKCRNAGKLVEVPAKNARS